MAASSPAEPIVVCRGITKEYGKGETRVMALRGINLEVYRAQLTLLVGPSGCGKTTLISVIAGILDPTEGKVVVVGTDLSALSRRQKGAFRRDNIGFVFQQFNLLPALTAAENAAVPLIVAGMPRRKAVARAAEFLDLMGLAARRNALPAQLSGGEQQRVAIARALVNEPRLIVCDEPTSALDAKTGQTIMELLRDSALQANRAVIVVTHDPRVFPFGDRVAMLEDGRVVRIEGRHQETRLDDITVHS